MQRQAAHRTAVAHWSTHGVTARRPAHAPNRAIDLQRTVGNRALHHLVAAGIARPKLRGGAPRDGYEQEADAVAERIVRMPEHIVQRKCAGCAGGASCAECAHDDEEHLLQRKAVADGGVSTASTAAVLGPLGTGRPLAHDALAYFEPRFGADFGGVRVHTGPTAETSARALNAAAYTIGRNIVFGEDQYRPETHAGRHLLAHELAHVLQQRTRGDVPHVQTRVVDDAEHVTCRTTRAGSAALITARETEAATRAEAAATALRARPLAEATRALLWTRFRLDYNDALVRCRFLPTIADRFADIADEIRNTDCVYRCTSTGEPETECTTLHAFAVTTAPVGRRIALCTSFWGLPDPEQALTILHEWAHYLFVARGLADDADSSFDNAECYAAFAFELAGIAAGWDDTLCPPATEPVPALEPDRVASACPGNVFLNIPLTGGYLYGLPGGRHYGTVSFGWDLLFPLTRMHDWELALGPRITAAIPSEHDARAAFLLGLRTAVTFRYRPWRTGFHLGVYSEFGSAVLPEPGGETYHPYASGGAMFGGNFPIGRREALQLFVDVGGGAGLDTRDSSAFGWFQAGLGVAFQFH